MPREARAASLTLPGLEESVLSPVRRQYLELKAQRPDAVLLFRLGDFYETFGDDARLVARVLDIALTSRDLGRGERLPMAGVPAQAAGGYVARLVSQGHHVAIADQVGEVPRTGLVRREITRVVTPGTVMEDDLLPGNRNNFLAAVTAAQRGYGLAYVDVSTGEVAATEIRTANPGEALAAELTRIGPAEVLVAEPGDEISAALSPGASITYRGIETFAPASAHRRLVRVFGSGAGLGELADLPLAAQATGALLAYLQETRMGALGTLQPPRLYAADGTMLLDRATRRNLDLLESSGTSGLSLVGVLDSTRTPMGARLLRRWVGQPLVDITTIGQRLDAVGWLVGDATSRARLGEALRHLPDLERLGVRAGQLLLAPRECLALAGGLEQVPSIQRSLGALAGPSLLDAARSDLVPLAAVAEAVRATLRENATALSEGVIRPGVSAELDAVRALGGDGRQWIAALEQRERERCGIRQAKVGYNKVFGYFLEVSAAQCAQPTDQYQREVSGAATVGDHLERLGWTRKQTVAHAERFVTPELKAAERRIGQAQEEAAHLERAFYNELLERLAVQAVQITATARAIALLDVLLSLAETAVRCGYSRPTVDESDALRIEGGRHPVVEAALPPGAFVPNDTALDSQARVMLLTGPNMAGKSTYLRQVALVTLLAQVGSFVPALSAHIGVVDRIFTRIGAQDDIASGQSTFMVEMTEAAAILRGATRTSLVVLDEIGRGTSTFDGMAMAQAIVEDLHNMDRPGGAPRTIFATHFHELTALSGTLPGLRNFRVDVLERGDEVVFLHSVVAGGADRSYGVHVAHIAGVPGHVTRRARSLLRNLEQVRPALAANPTVPAFCAVCADLAGLDVLALSPLQAQAELYRLAQRARETSE